MYEQERGSGLNTVILGPSERTPQAWGSGPIWHITSRGNERHSIFVDNEDREGYLALLGKVGS